MENKSLLFRLTGGVLLTVMLGLTSCKKENFPQPEPTDSGSLPLVNTLAKIPATETRLSPANGTFLIVNRKSGKLLDVSGAATANGTNVLQWGGNGGTNQRWTLTQLSGGYYSIIGVPSGRALEIYQSGTADSVKANIWDYSGANNQQWQFISLGDGYYRIVNRNSGKDLDVAGQSVADGAGIAQWSYWGGENQQWAFVAATYSGQLTWTLTSTGVPADVQTRITNAMNDACARYNAGANWPARTLTVQYNTGVATADGSTNGNIRFGPTASYQGVRTAMHEIAHTYGVGLSSGWSANISSGLFVGTNTVDVIKTYDGTSAVINTGGGHFWPYGLNYDSEWSAAGAYRHVKLVWAMRSDGM
ncbi:hypothetical protein HNQ91_001726 [Filimonas zeae]|uniref:Ricin B lectin domain-containing protein n=1 Tax=Filimonas zeae TaxID=1737353 RepID=A0A917IZB1_9BACT|nr:RICIN domain-containing protein [Filimonas zeae]MDR6338675.1 hypothetical protein [Filimonas zeae]GGH67108.1 hypothetical protein GCM10011379_22020 [Filimonas zeae]